MEKQGNKLGSWATVTKGPYARSTGRVIHFVPETTQDGILVPDGLKYFYLQGDGIPGGMVFRRDELEFNR